MKQYTDSERLDAMIKNGWAVYQNNGDRWLCRDYYETEITRGHDTPRAAIDDAMNREAERTANKQLKNITGGNAG